MNYLFCSKYLFTKSLICFFFVTIFISCKQPIDDNSGNIVNMVPLQIDESTPIDSAKKYVDYFRDESITNREVVYANSFPVKDLSDLLCNNSISLLSLSEEEIEVNSILSYLRTVLIQELNDQGITMPTLEQQCEFLEGIDFLKFYNGLVKNGDTYTPTLIMLGAKAIKNSSGEIIAIEDIIPVNMEVYQHTWPCPRWCNLQTSTSPLRISENKRGGSIPN